MIERKEFKELPHQAEAYKKVKKDLKTHDRVAANLATGVGKTLLMEHLIIDNIDKRFLVMTSTKKIISDHEKDINTYCWKRKGDKVLTPKNITYCLYQGFNNILDNKNAYDYIIFDEYHRLGGHIWNDKAKQLIRNNPHAKILGTSATPIRADGRNMTDELFNGYASIEKDLSEAIMEDILPYPDYHEAQYSFKGDIAKIESQLKNGDLSKFKAYHKALNEAKKKAFDAERLPNFFKECIPEGHGKFLVFCMNINHLSTLVKEADSWFPGIKVEKYYMHTNLSDQANKLADKSFELASGDDHIVLLFSVGMLGEGFHPENDGVIFFRPTHSHVVYLQQLGRAMTSMWIYTKKIPKIIDIVRNSEDLMFNQSYWTNLYRAKVKQTQDKRRKHNVNIILGEFHLNKNDEEIINILEKVNLLIGQNSSVENYVAHLEEFLRDHPLEIPSTSYVCEDTYELGKVTARLRSQFRTSDSNPIRNKWYNALNKINATYVLIDTFSDRKFKRDLNLFKDYFSKHPEDKEIPRDYVDRKNIELGLLWYSYKSYYKTNKLSAEQIKSFKSYKLLKLLRYDAFIEKNKKEFKKLIIELNKFYKKFKHYYIPDKYESKSGYRLASEFYFLPYHIHRIEDNENFPQEILNKIPAEALRIAFLTKKDLNLERRLYHYKEYFDKFGNFNVPKNYYSPDGFELKRIYHQDKSQLRASSSKNSKTAKSLRKGLKELGLLEEFIKPHNNVHIKKGKAK